MSHELRTPLNAIIGFSEIMESGMFGALGASKYHEYCRDIHRSGLYLLDVINDVLDMSKIEAGRIKLDLEEIELDRELADALRVISGRANEKRLKLTSMIAPNIRFQGRPARVQADRAQPVCPTRSSSRRKRAASRYGGGSRAASSSSASRILVSASRAKRCKSSDGRSSRSKASSPRPITARAWPRYRQIAGRAAWRRNAHPLGARTRHHRGGALADQRPGRRVRTRRHGRRGFAGKRRDDFWGVMSVGSAPVSPTGADPFRPANRTQQLKLFGRCGAKRRRRSLRL
jgi:hypothetical protein